MSTAVRRNGQDTPFGAWVRAHRELDACHRKINHMDIDRIWHRTIPVEDTNGLRLVSHIMFIEEKRDVDTLRTNQVDTMEIVDALIRGKSSAKMKKEKTCNVKIYSPFNGRMVHVKWGGYHVLRYFGADFFTANKILWDNKPIDIETLSGILMFERSAFFPWGHRSDRRHHAAPVLPLLKTACAVKHEEDYQRASRY